MVLCMISFHWYVPFYNRFGAIPAFAALQSVSLGTSRLYESIHPYVPHGKDSEWLLAHAMIRNHDSIATTVIGWVCWPSSEKHSFLI